jgi:adenylyltransferase/sulfurtransferase
MVHEKTVQELKAMMDKGDDFQLIDVREPNEYEICHIGGLLIPMNKIPEQVEKIAREKPVIIYCRSGARSARVIEYLQTAHNFKNLYNLRGGILAWANEIDSSLPKY